MKRTFERFTGSHAPANKTPSVTIQKRGVIALNRAAYDLLKRPQAVHLYFSPDEQIIGIAPSDPKAPDAILLRKQKGSASYNIAGMSFTKWYGIDSSIARRYEATAEGGDLYVDLKQPAKVVTSANKMRQQRVEARRAGISAPEASQPLSAAETEAATNAVHEVQMAMAHLETAVHGPGAKELLGEIRHLLERYEPTSQA